MNNKKFLETFVVINLITDFIHNRTINYQVYIQSDKRTDTGV